MMLKRTLILGLIVVIGLFSVLYVLAYGDANIFNKIEEINTSTSSDPFQEQFNPSETKEYEIREEPSGMQGYTFIGSDPYETELRIFTEDKILVKAVTSDAYGRFKTGLEPGRYIVSPGGEDVYPFAEPQIVVVRRDEYTDVVFRFER